VCGVHSCDNSLGHKRDFSVQNEGFGSSSRELYMTKKKTALENGGFGARGIFSKFEGFLRK
jgi:hypothetical protein